MTFEDVQREVEQLNRDEQRKLIGFLVAMDARRDEAYRSELEQRLEDRSPQNWISLKEARNQLKRDGV